MRGTRRLIHGRYLLTEPLATSGVAQLWQATDLVLGRGVAVKLLTAPADSPNAARFRAEARAMAALSHRGVVDVYDYGDVTGPDGVSTAYIIMACVDGKPLTELISEAGRLDAFQTATIVHQAADALQAVHDAGVVHRNVRPANLIVEADGHVVLIDFGLALNAARPTRPSPDELAGTASYMAPEGITRGSISPAVDIYALGAVAYHCLAGHPPFTDSEAVAIAQGRLTKEPPPLPDEVPAALRRVVATAMANDPARRYPNAASMADAVSSSSTDTVRADHRRPSVRGQTHRVARPNRPLRRIAGSPNGSGRG